MPGDGDPHAPSATATTPCSSPSARAKEKHLTKARARSPQEGRRAADAHARRVPRRGRGAARSARPSTVEAFEAGRTREDLRHLQGQGLPGHDQAPQLQPAGPSHGSHNVRAPGSIGASATPSRVLQGHPRPRPDGQQARHPEGPRGRAGATPRRTCCSCAARSPGPRGGDRGGAHRWLTRRARRQRAAEGRSSTRPPSASASTGRSCTRACAPSRPRAGAAPPRPRPAAMVSGGGAKPWRQKGTGRARAGSSRSPIWTGGGIVFGPQPRSYTFKVNRKEQRAALRSALSLHAERGSIAILDAAAFDGAHDEPGRRAARRTGASRGPTLVVLERRGVRRRAVVPQPRPRGRADRRETSASTDLARRRLAARLRGGARGADRPHRRRRAAARGGGES